MSEELVKVESGKIILPENVIKEINKFQKAKLKMDMLQEELKDSIKNAMENNGIDKYTSPDGTIVITYFPEKTTKRLDTTTLKTEQPELYDKYLKSSITKSFVKMVVK